MPKFRVVFGLALVWAFFISSGLSFANPPPSDAAGRCAVIHDYEALCGNNRPNPCLGLPTVHYFDNLTQQTTWDNYVNLCVNTTPSQDRYSHECIEYYHLGATCVSTVPDLVEYTIAPGYTTTATLASRPTQYQIAGNYEMVAYYCGLTVEQKAKINAYKTACGDIVPGSCSGSAGFVSDYRDVCGEIQPCECLSNKHCGPACPILGPPPVMPGDPTGGGGGGGSGGTTPSTDGSAAGPSSDSTFVSGFGTRNPPAATDSSNSSSGAVKSCSLNMSSTSDRPWASLWAWILLFALLIRSRLAKSRE